MESKNSGGISFGSLLALAFIVLKLCGVIKWSWVWVLSPVWIGLTLLLVVTIIYIFNERKGYK